jgi:hypothetical protein
MAAAVRREAATGVKSVARRTLVKVHSCSSCVLEAPAGPCRAHVSELVQVGVSSTHVSEPVQVVIQHTRQFDPVSTQLNE